MALDGIPLIRNCNSCFAAGTLVKTGAGYQPIESLKVGDLVPSEDTKTGAISLRRITHVHVRPVADIKTFYKLTVAKEGINEDFYVTGEHPFWLADKAEWRNVDDLRVGDTLLDYGSHRLHVSAKLALNEKRQTYNLTVEGFSTYFAGRSEVLVHNIDCILPFGFSRDQATGKVFDTAGKEYEFVGARADTGAAILKQLNSTDSANSFVTAGADGTATQLKDIKLSGGTAGNKVDYGGIPADQQWRYDRYLADESPKRLGPDDWWVAAQRVWAENAAGNGFEQEVRTALGAPLGQGSKPISINGRVPDLPVGPTYGVTDVKNWIELSNNPQMIEFYQYAAENGLPFNVIIGPRTQTIWEPLLDNIRATGGTVTEYNPVTRQFTLIDIGNSGAWKRN